MIESIRAFLSDLKVGARSLSRAKGLTVTVVATLALGIGANAAMFSLVRGVLLRPSPIIRFARPWNRVACYCGMVRRASSTRAASHCHHLPRKRRRCAALASSPPRRERAGCRMRKPSCDRSCDVRCLSRRGSGRAGFHVRVSDAGDFSINDHLSELRHGKGRDHANRCLPVFL